MRLNFEIQNVDFFFGVVNVQETVVEASFSCLYSNGSNESCKQDARKVSSKLYCLQFHPKSEE
jgi:GMP synthase-like glutamine amidotransferase